MASAKKDYPKPRSKKSVKKTNKRIALNNAAIKRIIEKIENEKG